MYKWEFQLTELEDQVKRDLRSEKSAQGEPITLPGPPNWHESID